jgi:hypothetical protein
MLNKKKFEDLRGINLGNYYVLINQTNGFIEIYSLEKELIASFAFHDDALRFLKKEV